MFDNGSEILRFDCHLHTNKDKEFKYNDDENKFINDFLDKMKLEEISIGVITNHNKFDYGQYKAMKKASKKRGIYILPGVELSIKEGASSIHMVVVFNPEEWLNNGIDYISRNIDSLFLCNSNPGNENTCTKDDLLSVIDKLNQQNKDYFMICAHVEQSKGFWNECNGTLIKALSADNNFRNRVLGFQKARTRDTIQKVHNWMGYELALVEGSDPKSINDIGKGDKKTYIKIGEASYSAVKYALKDYKNRLFNNPPLITHGYIKEMKFIGGKLDKQIFPLSHELNTLIGIRGSGKSSVLEVLRYALNKKPAQDDKYTDDLVKTVLGSGGEIELSLVDKYGKKYHLKRIINENSTIYDDKGNVLTIPVEEILASPLYFGQKDLALTRKGYEYELLNKIIGDKVLDISNDEHNIQNQLIDNIEKLRSLIDIPGKISDIKSENATLQHRLKIYQEKGLDEKLKKQTSCNLDSVKIDSISTWIQELIKSLEIAYLKDGRDILSIENYVSQYNVEIFNELSSHISKVNQKIDSIKANIDELKETLEEIFTIKQKLTDKIDSLKDEFAEIKRDINDEQLDADRFIMDQRKVAANNEKIASLTESIKAKDKICSAIKSGFIQRNELLKNNFQSYKNAINQINNRQDKLSISMIYKGDKDALKEKLMMFFKGTNLSDVKYSDLCEEFIDLPAIVEDYYLNEGKRIKKYCTDNIYAKVSTKIEDGYKELLTYDTPNVIDISYHGKLLSKHSLGQRASALILFILTQHESDVIIVDQPEDDLDNQVIYKELIQTLKKEKNNMQFIFATHNANIPVLGDAERVTTTEYHDDGSIGLKCGTIDSVTTHNDIISIMEGGAEAFMKRNEIYSAWK